MQQAGVNYSISYASKVSKEQVIEEAKEIWNELNKLNIKDKEDKLQAFFEAKYELHRDLFRAYPIVMKYMCLLHKFNPDAFGRHIDAYALNRAKVAKRIDETRDNASRNGKDEDRKDEASAFRKDDEEDFFALQADYVVDLIRVIKKTQKGGYYRNLRESIIIELREESEKIKKETEVARKKTEDNVKRFLQMDRQDLKDYITTLNKNTQDTPEKRDELFILKQVERIHDTRDTQANQVDIKPFEAEVTANDLLC